MTKITNLETAVGIVRKTQDKSLALSEIMNILGVSRSNAFVYHTKASRILAVESGMAPALAKITKAAKTTKESVQGTTATKKAQKLAEIDAFLASASSAKGNPFAQMGA